MWQKIVARLLLLTGFDQEQVYCIRTKATLKAYNLKTKRLTTLLL